MPKTQKVKKLVDDFRARRPVRGKSLIVTFFGDVISQHGGTVWLGSLVDCLALCGVSERLVRTSVFRLVKDDWLEAERVGRKSFYRFSKHGYQEYARAATRIYGFEEPAWMGQWQLVLLLNVADETLIPVKRSLEWLGFRAISSSLFAKPGRIGKALMDVIDEYDIHNDVLILDGTSEGYNTLETIRSLAYEKWNLEKIRSSYEIFIARYSKLVPASASTQRSFDDPETAFTLRLMLIHDFRRLLLIDTALPGELMVPGWPGSQARTLTAELYTLLSPASLEYIGSSIEGGNGVLTAQASPSFHERFR